MYTDKTKEIADDITQQLTQAVRDSDATLVGGERRGQAGDVLR